MAKQHRITWTKRQSKLLSNAVKDFNAKRKRIIDKNPVLENLLPPKMSVKGLKERTERLPDGSSRSVPVIETENDLQKTVRMLRAFTNPKNKIGIDKDTGELIGIRALPDNKYNTLVTDWQYKQMSKMARNVNKKRKEMLDIILPLQRTDRGKELGYTVGDERAEAKKNKPVRMGTIDENGLMNVNPFNYSMDRGSKDVKFWNLYTEDKTNYWENQSNGFKDSVIKTLQEQFGLEASRRLVEKIKSMSFEDFYKIYSAEGLDFTDFYPLSPEEAEYQLTRLEAIFL